MYDIASVNIEQYQLYLPTNISVYANIRNSAKCEQLQKALQCTTPCLLCLAPAKFLTTDKYSGGVHFSQNIFLHYCNVYSSAILCMLHGGDRKGISGNFHSERAQQQNHWQICLKYTPFLDCLKFVWSTELVGRVLVHYAQVKVHLLCSSVHGFSLERNASVALSTGKLFTIAKAELYIAVVKKKKNCCKRTAGVHSPLPALTGDLAWLGEPTWSISKQHFNKGTVPKKQ